MIKFLFEDLKLESTGLTSFKADIISGIEARRMFALLAEVEMLKKQLVDAKETILELRQREQTMKESLAEQTQKLLEKGIRFENICLDESKPTALIRK